MRHSSIVIALAALAGMAGWGTAASAQSVEFYVGPSAYDRYYYDYPASRSYYYSAPHYWYDGRSGYYERPEHYRPGSKRWWRQMDRNGRGGHQK